MKSLPVLSILFVLFLLNPAILSCQSANTIKVKDKIEVSSIIRNDSYRQFTYNLGRASDDYLSMKGLSWGINANFKTVITPNLLLKTGIGFYRYTFNKLSNNNTSFGHSTARSISYPSPLFIMFYTDRYWYNTLSANLGLEHSYQIKKNTQILFELNLSHYFSFSQHYHLTYNNINYNTHDIYYFGNSVNFNIGVVKKIGKFQIAPSIIIPLYDRWKKDRKFGDFETEPSEKWFHGIGVGFTVGKTL